MVSVQSHVRSVCSLVVALSSLSAPMLGAGETIDHSALLAAAPSSNTTASSSLATTKIGVVNFLKVMEQSKLGKQQLSSFEGMHAQMESLVHEREKTLTELVSKLEDPDFIDGLTPEKEQALKQQAMQMNQELEQGKQQFLQTLQQAKSRIIQMMQEDISKAATEIAEARGLDFVVSQEGLFYQKPSLDITDVVVQRLNEKFDRESKEKEEAPADTSKKAESKN